MKCEIEIPDELLKVDGDRYEPTGEFRTPRKDEPHLSNGVVWVESSSYDKSARIILRRVEPPKPVLRAFKGPEEVPGHLVWARLKSFDGDGRRVAFSPLSYGLVLLGSLTVDYKDAVNDVELAGTDLVWVPAGIEE
jgi:hypothetical protein